jgi:hypothetical protein
MVPFKLAEQPPTTSCHKYSELYDCNTKYMVVMHALRIFNGGSSMDPQPADRDAINHMLKTMPASTKGPRIHNLTSGRRTRRSGDRRTGFLQQLVRSGIFKLSEIYWLTDEHFGHLSGRIQYGLEPQSFVDLHSKPVICYEQDERSNPRLKSPK